MAKTLQSFGCSGGSRVFLEIIWHLLVKKQQEKKPFKCRLYKQELNKYKQLRNCTAMKLAKTL